MGSRKEKLGKTRYIKVTSNVPLADGVPQQGDTRNSVTAKKKNSVTSRQGVGQGGVAPRGGGGGVGR